MTKQTKIILMFGIPIVLIGGYFIYKRISGNKPSQTPIKDNTDGETKLPTISPIVVTPTPSNDNICKRYVVSNVSNYLNVRSTPSTSLKEIDFLFKGSTIYAKPSSTSGWMELCDMKGFVSSQYLKPFVPTSTKCVLQKGQKWLGGYEKDYNGNNVPYYYQNYKDLRSGLFYTRYMESKKPYNYDVSNWNRRYDNKDVADASWCGDFLANGKLDPNCIINRKELEDIYQSGATC
jgi:hypothetical protein